MAGTVAVALTSLGLFAWSRADGEPALQVFVALIGAVSVSCTYMLWWHRRGALWRKALWTLILLVPASGHLYFLAAYRVRDDEL